MPERKVGTTQSTILPNGKVPRKDGVTESAAENNRPDSYRSKGENVR